MTMFISSQKNTRDCYNDTNQIPLVGKKENAAEYVIHKNYIKRASKRHKNVTVVFTYSGVHFFYFSVFVL